MNDNVRKVFDLLGVEPNEEFKIKGFNHTKYYIDDNLVMFDEDGNVYGNLFRTILLDNDMIIKLPKKKKLRDLTEEEFENFCKTYEDGCSHCLFHNVPCSNFARICWIRHKDLYSDKFLDQEIEVEE